MHDIFIVRRKVDRCLSVHFKGEQTLPNVGIEKDGLTANFLTMLEISMLMKMTYNTEKFYLKALGAH